MPTSARPIADIARELGLAAGEWLPYGRDKAKVLLPALAARREQPDGKLVVVSSITPTPAGDGKTTMTIGLGQALWRIGARPVIALREPSIGPTLGMKGGGTGGGRSQVVPMEDINLHFTGDFHAIASAHNLLAAAVDNHLHHGNVLGMDVRQVLWRRVLDVNDRALRDIVVSIPSRRRSRTSSRRSPRECTAPTASRIRRRWIARSLRRRRSATAASPSAWPRRSDRSPTTPPCSTGLAASRSPSTT